jgi:hypothetical protein
MRCPKASDVLAVTHRHWAGPLFRQKFKSEPLGFTRGGLGNMLAEFFRVKPIELDQLFGLSLRFRVG